MYASEAKFLGVVGKFVFVFRQKNMGLVGKTRYSGQNPLGIQKEHISKGCNSKGILFVS